jgi:hypothetical protein
MRHNSEYWMFQWLITSFLSTLFCIFLIGWDFCIITVPSLYGNIAVGLVLELGMIIFSGLLLLFIRFAEDTMSMFNINFVISLILED